MNEPEMKVLDGAAVVENEQGDYEIHLVIHTRFTNPEHLQQLQRRMLDSCCQVEKNFAPKIVQKKLNGSS